jgi:chemotaxis protein CheD
MSGRHSVAIAEYRLAEPPELLVTYGLGSCVAITLHDAERRLGGLAHTLLPAARSSADLERPAKFVDAAIQRMVGELVARGAERQRLAAKIFGGANMFESLLGTSDSAIGTRNVCSARETLAALAIPLLAEDVGGNFGRTVEFDPVSGQVRVHAVRGREGERFF